MYSEFIDAILTSELRSKSSNHKVLDVGCGSGQYVFALSQKGYDAFGTDVEFKPGAHLDRLIQEGKLKKIEAVSRKDITETNANYLWPFEDSSFDSVASRAVVEHVKNMDEFVAENRRVIRTNGYSIHYFPSMYSLIEPHVGVPLGGLITSRSYFRLCCNMGLCNKKYKGLSLKAYNYVKEFTEYRKVSEIIKAFESGGFEYYGNYTNYLLKFYRKGKYSFIGKSKFLLWLFRLFRSNIVVFKACSTNKK